MTHARRSLPRNPKAENALAHGGAYVAVLVRLLGVEGITSMLAAMTIRRVLSTLLLASPCFAQSGTFEPRSLPGCPDPSPPQLGVATTPDLGAVARVEASALPASTAGTWLLLGTQTAELPLDAVGAPGCRVYVGGVVLDLAMSPNATSGTAALDLPIPNSQALIGAELELQAVALTPSTNAAGLSLGHSGQLTIGRRTPLPVTAGLVAHYDATDPLGDGSLPEDGSELTTWHDVSGLQHHARALPRAPFYRRSGPGGHPAVDFSRRGDDGLTTGPSAAFDDTDWTVFVVGADASTALFSMSEPGTINHEVLLMARSGPRLSAQHHTRHGNWFEVTHQDVSAGPFLQEAVFGQSPTAVANFAEGSPSTTGGRTVGSPTSYPNAVIRALTLGRRGDSRYENGAAKLHEVLLYDRVLTRSERDQVGAHLAIKYGIPTAYPGS